MESLTGNPAVPRSDMLCLLSAMEKKMVRSMLPSRTHGVQLGAKMDLEESHSASNTIETESVEF